MALDGEPVSNEVLFEVYNDITPVLEMVDAELEAAGDSKLTFFEALAVLGFAVFADAPVDVLVLEVGMGGEWDSTNVADGDVAVFTPISLDHTDRLGNTVEEIALTKSGIIKQNALVVSSKQDDGPLEILASKTIDSHGELAVFGTDFEVLSASIDGYGQRISVRGTAGIYPDLYLPLYGAYQSENLALAIAAVESFLGGQTVAISDEILRIAVADATSPGRLQVVSREPITVIDAAHNPHGAHSLANALRDFFAAPATIGIVGVLGDKDAAGLLSALAESFDHLIVTKSSSPRALDENDLANIAREFFDADAISVSPNLAEAYELAKDMLPNDGAIIVTGSVSMAGDLLKMFREDEELEEQVD